MMCEICWGLEGYRLPRFRRNLFSWPRKRLLSRSRRQIFLVPKIKANSKGLVSDLWERVCVSLAPIVFMCAYLYACPLVCPRVTIRAGEKPRLNTPLATSD